LIASALNSIVYCLLLINTSVIAMNYGCLVSTKAWPVQMARITQHELSLWVARITAARITGSTNHQARITGTNNSAAGITARIGTDCPALRLPAAQGSDFLSNS
jgi:hypothetical protein